MKKNRSKGLKQLNNTSDKGLVKLKDINLSDYNVLIQNKIEEKTYTVDSSEISTEGDSGTSEPITITYAALYALYNAGTLSAGQKYRFEYENIYDQSVTDVTKTGAAEWLVVTAESATELSPIAFSENYPKDIIHYDISKTTTLTNLAPTKGKITYRECTERRLKTPFCFRTVLMIDVSDMVSEALMFDLNSTIRDVEIVHDDTVGIEFPVGIFEGNVINAKQISLLGAKVLGDVNDCVRVALLDGTVITGNLLASSCIELGGVTVGGNVDSVENCLIYDTTFTEDLQKQIGTNYNNSSIGGDTDRNIESVALTTTFGADFRWNTFCPNFSCDFSGDFIHNSFLNNTSLTTTDCGFNGNIGISPSSSICGFDTCTITGNGTNEFVNNSITCRVANKTITSVLHPELFLQNIHCTIFKRLDGTIWYSYTDNTNTVTYTQIV